MGMKNAACCSGLFHPHICFDVAKIRNIIQTCKFLKTLNNQELYVGHPVDLTLSDGTVKTPRIDKLLIESGKQYVIDFT